MMAAVQVVVGQALVDVQDTWDGILDMASMTLVGTLDWESPVLVLKGSLNSSYPGVDTLEWLEEDVEVVAAGDTSLG